MGWTEKPTDLLTPADRTEFTPVVKLGTGNTGLTFTSITGLKTVTKDGVCHFSLKAVIDAVGSSTGAITVELPDIAAHDVAVVIGGSRLKCTGTATAKIAGDSNAIQLFDMLANGNAPVALDHEDLDSGSILELSGSYLVKI